MSRKLSDEERALWDRTRETVRALPKRRTKTPAAEPPDTKPSDAKPRNTKSRNAKPSIAPAGGKMPAARPTPSASKSGPGAKPGPALAPLEPRTRRRLARGGADVDARIDLHGMRQERAFTALVSFLRQAQADGHRLVLVVTGKGGKDRNGDNGGEGRGVLRQAVPAWLSRPDLRALVIGWEEAGSRHGGAGALYVRIRRRREARRKGA